MKEKYFTDTLRYISQTMEHSKIGFLRYVLEKLESTGPNSTTIIKPPRHSQKRRVYGESICLFQTTLFTKNGRNGNADGLL